eukprot:3534490-Prymnesium_polylepis.2
MGHRLLWPASAQWPAPGLTWSTATICGAATSSRARARALVCCRVGPVQLLPPLSRDGRGSFWAGLGVVAVHVAGETGHHEVARSRAAQCLLERVAHLSGTTGRSVAACGPL